MEGEREPGAGASHVIDGTVEDRRRLRGVVQDDEDVTEPSHHRSFTDVIARAGMAVGLGRHH
jgi:hypothetical protein